MAEWSRWWRGQRAKPRKSGAYFHCSFCDGFIRPGDMIVTKFDPYRDGHEKCPPKEEVNESSQPE